MQTAASADPGLQLVFQGLCPKSNNSGIGELNASTRLFRNRRAAFLATKKFSVWEDRSRFDFMQVLSGLIRCFTAFALRTIFCVDLRPASSKQVVGNASEPVIIDRFESSYSVRGRLAFSAHSTVQR